MIHLRTDHNELNCDAIYVCGITTAELRAAGDKAYHRDESISDIAATEAYADVGIEDGETITVSFYAWSVASVPFVFRGGRFHAAADAPATVS